MPEELKRVLDRLTEVWSAPALGLTAAHLGSSARGPPDSPRPLRSTRPGSGSVLQVR